MNQKKEGTDTHQNHLVCGLHTPANLQILTAEDNLNKSHYRWPDMWSEEK